MSFSFQFFASAAADVALILLFEMRVHCAQCAMHGWENMTWIETKFEKIETSILIKFFFSFTFGFVVIIIYYFDAIERKRTTIIIIFEKKKSNQNRSNTNRELKYIYKVQCMYNLYPNAFNGNKQVKRA